MVREAEPPEDIRQLAELMRRWRGIYTVEYEDLLERVRHELDEDAREATRRAVEEAFA